MLNGRKRLITALSAIALAAAVGLVPGTAQAEPDIDDVQTRVDRLYHEAEQASERYNDAKLDLAELQSDLDAVKADEKRQDDASRRASRTGRGVHRPAVPRPGALRRRPGRRVRRPPGLPVQLSTMSSFNQFQEQLFDDYSREQKALDIRREATKQRAAEVSKLEEQLGREKATIDKKLDEAQSLLGRLKAEEREALLASRSSQRVPVERLGLRARRRRGQLRDGPGRRQLRLRRGRPERLRLLRPDHDGRGRRPVSASRTPRALSTAPARTSRPTRCSPATWSSTTSRSATSACTSATA